MDARKQIWTVILFVLILTVGFYGLVLSGHHWDALEFVHIGEKDATGKTSGYDAQWYYWIALDPLGAQAKLDQPAYRYQRLIFPVLTRLFGLGQPSLIPWAMLGINLAATLAVSAALAALLLRRGVSPWYSIVLMLSVGYLFSLRFIMLEPLTLAFALSGIWFYAEKRPTMAIALFALSGLTKEVGLVFPLALAVALMLDKRWREAAYLLLGSFLPYLIWYVFLYLAIGPTPSSIYQSTPIWLPFSGLKYLQDATSRILVIIWVIAPAILSALLMGWSALREGVRGLAQEEVVLLMFQIGFIALMPAPTWQDPMAVLRVGLGFLAALFLWLAAQRPRLLPYAAALWGPTGLILMIVPGMIR